MKKTRSLAPSPLETLLYTDYQTNFCFSFPVLYAHLPSPSSRVEDPEKESHSGQSGTAISPTLEFKFGGKGLSWIDVQYVSREESWTSLSIYPLPNLIMRLSA